MATNRPFPFTFINYLSFAGLEGGEAKVNKETTAVEFFGEDEIPPLSLSRVTPEQIQFCFETQQNPDRPCRFD